MNAKLLKKTHNYIVLNNISQIIYTGSLGQTHQNGKVGQMVARACNLCFGEAF